MSLSLLVIILTLYTVCYTITTSLTLGLTDLRFASSCYTASYTKAEQSCTHRNQSLFILKDLVNVGASDVFNKAGDEHGTFWMNKSSGSNCTVGLRIDGKVGLKTRPCSLKMHYICTIKSENAEHIPYAAAYIPCLESTTKETSEMPALNTAPMNTSIETSNPLQTSQMSSNSVTVIAVCLSVTIIVVAGTVIAIFLFKRHRKPRKYPVREMSALYHRENPCIDKPPVTSEGDDVTNTGVTIGVGVVSTNGKVDHDSLLKTETEEDAHEKQT